MKLAPIQLIQVFKRVHVELDAQHAPENPINPLLEAFVFDGIPVSTEFGIGLVDANDERGQMYLTSLRVVVDNKAPEGKTLPKYSPYLIDVEAGGVVLLSKGAEKLGRAEDLVSVNGASLLWSSIREQVLSLTARMPAGPVTLPTVNFHDLRLKPDEPAATPTKSAVMPSKRAATRSVKPLK
jgi:preprotein translocase subunit SecB